MRTLFSLTAIVSLVAAGCSRKPADDEVPGPAPAPAHTGPALSNEDYTAFARDLESALAAGDQAAVTGMLRPMDLFERSLSDLNFTPRDRSAILRGAKRSGDQWAVQFINQVGNGGKYTLLRIREVDGKKHLIMRLVGAEGAVNYHDFTLIRYPDGRVGTEDIYIYAAGETVTQMFRRIMMKFAAEHNRGIVDRLTGSEQVFIKHVASLQRITELLREGEARSALTLFHGLPEELKSNKVFQLIAIQAAQQLDEETYLAELDRFRKAHPNDPAADLLMIDYYTIKMDYDRAGESLDRLDRAVGGDAYLVAVKAALYSEAGRPKDARAAYEKAIAADPKLDIAYSGLISITLEEKDFAATLKWLKKGSATGAIAVDLQTIKDAPEYADFVKSPEYRKLQEWFKKSARSQD